MHSEKRMRKRRITRPICIFWILLSSVGGVSAFAYSGRVYVSSAVASPSEAVGLGVYLGGNDAAFSGLTVPLHFDTAVLAFDSMSLIGSILSPTLSVISFTRPDSGHVRFTAIPPFTPPIPSINADSGLLARLWFTVRPSAGGKTTVVDSLYDIDTISILPLTLLLRRVELSDPSGTVTYLPLVFAGQVSVLGTAADDEPTLTPNSFALEQNYPNPFNPSTTINFSLPLRAHTTLRVYNLLGQEVVTLVDGPLGAGPHAVSLDASHLPSGVYFYRLVFADRALTRRMVLAK